VYKNLIPEDDILCRINQVIDFSFVNEECSDLYSLNSGRPVTNTPERMFRLAMGKLLFVSCLIIEIHVLIMIL